MQTQCPFIYSELRVSETISKIKPIDLRIDCYEEKCPAKMWVQKKCLNPEASESEKVYIGGHCSEIVNICETCKDLHKCKRSGDGKDSCRQQRIDQILRKPKVAEPHPSTQPTPRVHVPPSITSTQMPDALKSAINRTDTD